LPSPSSTFVTFVPALVWAQASPPGDVDPQLARIIATLPAIDDHAHRVLPPPNLTSDRNFDALPVDNMEPQTDPVGWRPDIAVPLAVLMGFVASRVTGETDVTPTKALGPVTQMIYGAITPGNLTGNIMSANVTGGIGLHAADLLTTLKTGWRLGAKPRHQVYAQLFGVLAGAAIIVPLFYVVVPIAQLGTDQWPAPSAIVWANVSKAFVGGIDALPHSAKLALGIGLAFGIGLTLLDKAAPKAVRPYLPSPSAFGLAMVVPFSNSLAFFLGAAAAELVRRRYPRHASYTVPVASGVIAGESLVAIAITIATTVL